MMPKSPVYRYRPTRVRDGVGGSTEVLGTPITVYGALTVNAGEVVLIVDAGEDVLVKDIIAVRED